MEQRDETEVTHYTMVVKLVFGGVMSLTYDNASTCMNEARLLEKDRKFIEWVHCEPSQQLSKGRK